MLRCAVAVYGADGSDFAYGGGNIGNPPPKTAWRFSAVEYWDIDNQAGVVWECGVYVGANVDNPESDVESSQVKSRSWGLIQPKWVDRCSGVVIPEQGLYSGRSEVVVYIRKEAVGAKSVCAWLYYEEEKVSDETLIGLRRVGGYAVME
jgi:hypothetical protein